LGGELYLELRSYFPLTWGRLLPAFNKKFEENFEVGMQSVFATPDVPLLMRNMAEYFCEFRPVSDSNLYLQFLTHLKPLIKDIVFSTLNYDLLFELAARQINLPVSYFENANDKVNLLKLHGSCNFLPPQWLEIINSSFVGTNLVDFEIRAVDAEEVIRFCNSNTSVYPAMCIYMYSKPTQFGSSRIGALQDRWKDQVSKAEKVLLIGIRPYPDDEHIWNPLVQTTAKMGYVGSEKPFTEWEQSYRPSKDNELIGERWSDCLSDSVDFLR
jgi:hypothetical protein